MKSVVILLALAAFAYGAAIPDNVAVSTKEADNDKFTVEIRLSIMWFIHQHRCNGALIDGEWIVVPAQCVQSKPFYGTFEVLAGSTIYNIREVVLHEKADNMANDIALVRLTTRVPYTETVRPINLPFPNAEFSESATLYKRGSAGEVQASSVSLKSRSDCTETPRPISFGHICAGDNQVSAVKGDEGSALAVSDGLNGNVLIGLLSFAKSSPAPAVFTKVSTHVNWILEQQSKAV